MTSDFFIQQINKKQTAGNSRRFYAITERHRFRITEWTFQYSHENKKSEGKLMNLFKRKEKKQIDLLSGPLLPKIIRFALPLAAASILQQLFNAADLAVVGRFAGNQALAAVGSNTSMVSLVINLFVGLSIGANVVIGHCVGMGDEKKISSAVQTVMVISIISGIFVSIVGIFVARPILVLMGTPYDVIDLATLYLRIYFAGMPLVMVFNFGSAILRSIGDSLRPLYSLVIAGIINVSLNLLFVIVFRMGVVGVGLATVISGGISAVLVVFFLLNEEYPIKLYPSKLHINREILVRVLRMGVPAGLQAMVFSFSNVCIQSAVNSFGSDVVAGSAAGFNFEYFTYFVISAFTQAAVTFTSQNYGAGNFERCRQIYKRCMIAGMLFTLALSLVFVAFDEFWTGLYSRDPIVMEYAIKRMWHVAFLEFMTGSYEITAGSLRGIGYSLLPTGITVVGTCVFRVCWVFLFFPHFQTFDMLLTVYPISWTITGSAMIIAYFIARKKTFNRETLNI